MKNLSVLPRMKSKMQYEMEAAKVHGNARQTWSRVATELGVEFVGKGSEAFFQ
jgi:hypothetical protein